ncbi:major facilitator superfamily domain-containing protein [Scleroderma yunnanense]
MHGVGGKPAWSWIFILEGLVTVVAGAISPWIIVNFPEDATFLTEAERTVAIRRLQNDDRLSAAKEGLRCKDIKKSVTEWKTYLASLDMPAYALALFVPSIVYELGYTATPANLMAVPVSAAACMCTCAVGFLSDRYGHRGLFNLICLPVSAIGYIILLASRDAKLSYFAVYLATCGIYPCIANTVTWVADNVEGSSKRSISLAMVVGWGNLQGVVSSNVYRANQIPWYPLGHGLSLMYVIFAIIATVTLRYTLKKENDRRDRGERDEVIQGQEGGHSVNGCFGSVEEAKREKGDEWSGYRYTL